MGLDVSHGAWSGSYSGFREFRNVIAKAAGEEFGYSPDYTIHPQRAYYGWWDDDHKYGDPLDVFFIHSDCEGYIFPQDIDPLVERLNGLKHRVPTEPLYPGSTTSWWMLLQRFIDGLRKARKDYGIMRFH